MFSYNALFHLIITERGFGKTFGFLIKSITAFHYKGIKTLFLTKFINEVKGDTKEDSYPYTLYNTLIEIQDKIDKIRNLGLDITLNGRHILINGEIAFSCYAINEAEPMKKITELKTYGRIAHDECIRFERYCKNEIDKLFTIYDTVDRRQNKTKLFLMGNAITWFNIYMDHFASNIKGYGFHFDKERRLLVHISSNEAYQKERQNSAITKLAGEDSKYTQMASKGVFIYDNDEFVNENLEDFERHVFGLVIDGKEITLSKFRSGYYLHSKKKANRLFHNKMPSTSSVFIGKERLSKLKALYFAGVIYYQNIEIKNNFVMEYIKGARY